MFDDGSYFTYACVYISNQLFLLLLLCFDPGIQYSFRRCIISPPTVYQRKHRQPEELSMVVEVNTGVFKE